MPDQRSFTLDQTRDDFAALADELDFLKERLAATDAEGPGADRVTRDAVPMM